MKGIGGMRSLGGHKALPYTNPSRTIFIEKYWNSSEQNSYSIRLEIKYYCEVEEGSKQNYCSIRS